MTKGRRVDVTERRARLVRRHHLGGRSSDIVQVARDLVGIHSSDATSVYLGVHARVENFEVSQLEAALYEARSLGRILGMRRTMFVLPIDLIPVVHAAVTRRLALRERKRTIQFIEQSGLVKDGSRWLRRVETDTLAALEARGQATATELSEDVPVLRKKVVVGEGKKWEGTIGMSTRVLFLLANDAKVVRTRPRGSWISTQYRWAPFHSWLGADAENLPEHEARAELARHWLATFGPATLKDLKWWTGWSVAHTKMALTELDVVEVDLDGVPGMSLADDLEPVTAPPPRAALLPALDSTVMGWAERVWYLGAHRNHLFDRNGNAGPTVWWDGHVVGGWAQRPDGEIVVRWLEDAGSDAAAAVDEEARALERWLGDVRVIPRFRTPLERELSA